MRGQIIWIFFSFIVTILVFALIYNIQWLNNTSDFMVHEGYNMRTLPWDIYVDELPERFNSKKRVSIDETNVSISNSISKIRHLDKEIVFFDSLVYVLESIDSSDLLWSSYDQNLGKALEIETASFKTNIDSLEKCLSEYIKAYMREEVGSDTQMAMLKYQIALQKYELAKAEARLYNRRFEDYFDSNLLRQRHLIMDSISKLKTKTSELNGIRSDTWLKLKDIIFNYHKSRVESLNFIDFIYFSALVATNSGGGEIIPNSTAVRMVVIIQVFISILFLAYIIDRILYAIRK